MWSTVQFISAANFASTAPHVYLWMDKILSYMQNTIYIERDKRYVSTTLCRSECKTKSDFNCIWLGCIAALQCAHRYSTKLNSYIILSHLYLDLSLSSYSISEWRKKKKRRFVTFHSMALWLVEQTIRVHDMCGDTTCAVCVHEAMPNVSLPDCATLIYGYFNNVNLDA